MTGANVYASGLTYNALGQIKQMSFGNGAATTYDYYGDGGPATNSFRLWRSTTAKNGTPLLDLQYGYDTVGNINRITDTVNSAQIQTFSYDALDRLTTAATNAVGSGQYSEGYTYNAIGNITNTSRLGNYTYAATADNCSAGTLPLKPHAVSQVVTRTFSYDCNGNMLTRNETGVLYNQSWGAENHLKVVTNTVTGEVTKFVYDGDGVRVKQIYSGTYTSTTIYLGAPVEINILGAPLPPPTATIPPTMTYRAYLPLVAGGQPVPPRTQPFANETWKMYYAVGNQVIAMRSLTMTGSVVNYLHSDHLGSTSLATDASGAAVPNSRQMYYPYGEPRVKGTSLPTDIGFTGQRTDATGLMYYQARYYTQGIGRFVSADTMVPSPSDPQQLNRYAYARGNPVRYIDPSGHFIQCTEIPSMGQQCSDDGYSVNNPMLTSEDEATRRYWLTRYATNLAHWAKETWITNLEALAQLSDFAASMIPQGMAGRAQAYANDMSYTLVGSEGSDALIGAFFRDHVPPVFGDSGFYKDYQDGQNQLYHFWAYVVTVANNNGPGGHAMGLVGNIFHEMFDPTDAAHKLLEGTAKSGYSWQDYYLSMQGMAMGEALANGSLSIGGAGDYIRMALSQPYAGTEDDQWRAAGTDYWPSKIWEGLLVSLFK